MADCLAGRKAEQIEGLGRWVEQKAERTADQVDIPTGLTRMSSGDRLLGWSVDHSADLIRRLTASGRPTCQKAGQRAAQSIAQIES